MQKQLLVVKNKNFCYVKGEVVIRLVKKLNQPNALLKIFDFV